MALLNNAGHDLDALLRRPRPSVWQQFWGQPYIFLARLLYTHQAKMPYTPIVDPVTIICSSDTHNSQPKLPDGDILVHAGDLSPSGTLEELQRALHWIASQPHPIKIVVAGNHDLLLDPAADTRPHLTDATAARESLERNDIVYLKDTEVHVTCPNGRRLKVFGSPRSPRHGNWAFQHPRSENVWEGKIPHDIDILITHGPPRAHLDLNLGCTHLLSALWRTRPRLHVFGHVHEGAGIEWLRFDGLQAAYESTVVRGWGCWNLILTAWTLLRDCVSPRPRVEAKCLLVNAAVVGGLRDDERRESIKVTI